MAFQKKDPDRKSDLPLRNYLTLIVVFVAAIAISASVAFAFAAQHVDRIQLWIFILFLTLLPVFGLAVITRLVLRHANKLSVGKNDDAIDWSLVSSSKQKVHLNSEVTELARILKVPAKQMTDLRSAYIVAEDLALRKIQEEERVPLMRYVNIGNTEFSAVCINKDLITCIEVTFVVTPDIRQQKIDKILKKLSAAKTTINRIREGSNIRLLLVVVTQLDLEAEAKLRSSLVGKFSSTPVNVDIRILDFQTLQKVYAES